MEAHLTAVPRAAAAFGMETDAGEVRPETAAGALERIPVVRIVRDSPSQPL